MSLRTTIVACLFAVLLGACDRSPQEPLSQPEVGSSDADFRRALQQAPPASPPAPAPVETSGDYRLAGTSRLVAIGDLHGDFAATERAFRLAGVIDGQGHWSGGETTIVQTGDQLDRGDDERQIIDFLSRLGVEAKKAGGAVVVLNGNHETMNVLGDFRYVTPGAMDAFSDMLPRSPLADSVPGSMKGRAGAFLPGGAVAKILAERPIIAMVGKTVFVHGGVVPAHVDFGIDRLNEETSKWMRGGLSQPPAPVVDPEGPLWTRLYGSPIVDDAACQTLTETLRRLSAERMVVGHTPQDKGMSGACGDRVFRIDVGLAAHYGDRAVQVLEIVKGKARILTEGLDRP